MSVTTELAGIDIGEVVESVLVGESLVLRRYVEGAAKADINAGNERTTASYDCRGYVAKIESLHLGKEVLVRAGTVAFGLYGSSLTVIPLDGDRVYDGTREYVVYMVDGGRTRAVFTLLTIPAAP